MKLIKFILVLNLMMYAAIAFAQLIKSDIKYGIIENNGTVGVNEGSIRHNNQTGIVYINNGYIYENKGLVCFGNGIIEKGNEADPNHPSCIEFKNNGNKVPKKSMGN